MAPMSEQVRITHVARVPLRELDVRELERLDCYWLEGPLPRYAFADLARLAGDGCMAVPTGPGLGVSIDPDAVA